MVVKVQVLIYMKAYEDGYSTFFCYQFSRRGGRVEKIPVFKAFLGYLCAQALDFLCSFSLFT